MTATNPQPSDPTTGYPFPVPDQPQPAAVPMETPEAIPTDPLDRPEQDDL